MNAHRRISRFSKLQMKFLDKFMRFLEFHGDQLAMAEWIGCDQSSISRWANRETAPRDYICRLLLKELGNGSMKRWSRRNWSQGNDVHRQKPGMKATHARKPR